jgi:hypothetical protein
MVHTFCFVLAAGSVGADSLPFSLACSAAVPHPGHSRKRHTGPDCNYHSFARPIVKKDITRNRFRSGKLERGLKEL